MNHCRGMVRGDAFVPRHEISSGISGDEGQHTVVHWVAIHIQDAESTEASTKVAG